MKQRTSTPRPVGDKPPCPCCGARDAKVDSTKPKYLNVNGDDIKPKRQVLICRNCKATYDTYVVVFLLEAGIA